MLSVEEVVAKVLRVPRDQVTDASSSTTLKRWDSFAQLNLIVELEDVFGVKFTTTEMATLKSIAALKARLRELGATP
jgi:acyl carrier protein